MAKTHYRIDDGSGPVCGVSTSKAVCSSPEFVTCGKCRQALVWRKAHPSLASCVSPGRRKVRLTKRIVAAFYLNTEARQWFDEQQEKGSVITQLIENYVADQADAINAMREVADGS
jgi:hypothetical protein